jgi:hypothetical protein
MATCTTGKVAHSSESAARQAAVAVARVRTHDRPRVYECPRCHCWHLTSAPKLRRAIARRRHRWLEEPTPATRAELDAWFALHSRRGQVLEEVSET